MHRSWQSAQRAAALFLLVAFGMALLPASLEATDKQDQLKYTAVVIWGTDDPKPTDKELKAVDPGLVEKFKNIFKWKHYYEISRKDIDLKNGVPKHVTLSDKCDIKLNLTENEGLEVELFGEKKSVYKGKQSMPLKDVLIVAGDDKNATAWFVVLKPRH